MRRKYFKPGSLTWWASVAPLVAGCVLATEPLHGWGNIAQTLRNFAGDVPPAVMINAGLAGIGIRGAMS
ncbi:MAG: hypothetical protein N4A70_05520 [Pelagimonas sp.]|jgi:hypothetical protein|nr:hypothetical protein [Pelagimonas sp.]